MAGPTFAGTILAVPELASICSIAMTDGTPGSGTKLMRLVSKQLRSAMLGTVRSFALVLDGSGVGMMQQMTVLQDTRLSCLRVLVIDDTEGTTGRLDCDGFVSQLRSSQSLLAKEGHHACIHARCTDVPDFLITHRVSCHDTIMMAVPSDASSSGQVSFYKATCSFEGQMHTSCSFCQTLCAC